MKKKGLVSFIQRLILFSILSSLLLYGSNYLLSKLLFETWYLKDNPYAWLSKTKNQLVLMGSSTVKAGLNAIWISQHIYHDNLSTVNLGMMPNNPIKQYFTIYQNFESIKENSIFIIGIDPWTYSEKYYKYEPVLLHNWSIKNALFMLFKENYVWGCIGGQTDKLIELKFRKILKHQEVPYNNGSVCTRSPDKTIDTLFTNWVSFDEFNISNLYFQYLDSLVTLIRKKTSNIYLYYPPRRSDYLEGFNRLTYMTEFRRRINLIKVKHGLQSIDFEYILPKKQEFWVDPVHLSPKGLDTVSILFSNKINDLLGKNTNFQNK